MIDNQLGYSGYETPSARFAAAAELESEAVKEQYHPGDQPHIGLVHSP